MTAVNIAIPAIMSSLSASLDQIQWVLTGFAITRTVLIPSVGWLGGRIGDRNLFMLSMAIFTAGSLLCSVSWNADSLVFFRIIQAVGAGPLIAVAMSIMFEAFPRHERGMAMGLFMTGWSIGPFFGPLLGGYLVQYVDWRAIFYINIPFGLLSIAAAYFMLPQEKKEKEKPPFDLPGFLTLTGGTVTLLLALSQGQELGWGSQWIAGLFFASAVLWALFVAAELRSRKPYIEVRHFRSFNFGLANLIIFFRVFGFRGANFLLSLFLQRGLNYTPIQAGLFLLPGAVITGTVSPAAGILSDRLTPRVPLLLGLVILIFALYGLSTITIWTSITTIFLLIIFKSIGQSAMNAPLNTVALGALPEGEARMGSGMIGLSRGLGEAFAIAILSFLLERHTVLNLDSMTPLQGARLAEAVRYDVLTQIKGLLVHAGQYGAAVEDRAQALLGYSLLKEAVIQAYQDLFLLIAAMYVVMIVCVLFLRSGKKRDISSPERSESPMNS
jgi:DHA2 family multidrug resistance protein